MRKKLTQDDIELAIYRWLEGYGVVDGESEKESFDIEFKKQTKLSLSDIDIKIGAVVEIEKED